MTAHILVNDEIALTGVLSRQRAAFLRDGPPSFSQRRSALLKLKKALLARRSEFETALAADFGNRSGYETRIIEIIPLIQGINYLKRNLRRWMRPERRHVAIHFFGSRAYVTYQPLGVVGVMSPWNYPVALALMPLATAIAAGNRVMLKPSELTPATTALVAKMLRDIFTEDEVAVVTGGPETGAAFAGLPFDHLVFTGSTAVGRSVMKAAAENLVPVTLELGGKSPVIVDAGADIERAAASIAYGKLANAGQTCIAPDYALVRRDRLQTFVRAYESAVLELYPKLAQESDFTSIINARHLARLRALIADARKKGAEVIEMGAAAAASVGTNKLAPTIILQPTDDMAVMQEEIFGPLLPVLAYDDIEDAIGYINDRPRPLSLYYFGPDGDNRRKTLARTTSGNVTVNDTLMHYPQDDLPFGGVGPSGMGAYHGIEGFRALSHAKGVFEQARWNFTGFLRPPFDRMTDLVVRYMLR